MNKRVAESYMQTLGEEFDELTEKFDALVDYLKLRIRFNASSFTVEEQDEEDQ